MAQIKKDTSLRKAILQAAITGQLISDIGGESLPLPLHLGAMPLKPQMSSRVLRIKTR